MQRDFDISIRKIPTPVNVHTATYNETGLLQLFDKTFNAEDTEHITLAGY